MGFMSEYSFGEVVTVRCWGIAFGGLGFKNLESGVGQRTGIVTGAEEVPHKEGADKALETEEGGCRGREEMGGKSKG